jgi:hypothetical protein
MKMNKILIGMMIAFFALTSCANQDITYPDFDYSTVYFPNQFPVRTVELGNDLYVDNTNDNLHKVIINATLGGVRENTKNVLIDFKVDTTLCSGIYFSTGAKVVPMPSNYYTLSSTNQIAISKGSVLGGVQVQLTDAFFADPKSLINTYVIPLSMTNVQGADSILKGNPLVLNPNPCVDANWTIKPKNFILYAVKYVNPWQGNYMRRGTDQITKTSDGSVTTNVRHTQYVENNELVNIATNALTVARVPLKIKNSAGKDVPFNLILTFANDGTCTVTGDTPASFEITGTGKFVTKGEVKSIGGSDRDGLYLDYSVNFKSLGLQYSTKDTFVVRDRGVAPEYFTVTKK